MASNMQLSSKAFVATPVSRTVKSVAPKGRRVALLTQNAVKDVFMPALSSTMTEGKIVSWLKQPGDKVAKGESIVVVESDKADMDVESFSEGILGAIVIPEGGVASVGSPIAFIAESEADLAAAKEKAGAASNGAAAPPAAPAPAPAAAAPAPAAAAPAPAAAAPAPAAPAPAPAAAAPAPVAQPRADGRIIATPYAKKLAKDLGVDLSVVIGTGPAGRITASDVEAAKAGRAPAAAAPAPAAAAEAAPKAAAPVPAPAAAATTVSELRGTTQPFNTLQAAVSRNMLAAKAIPEFHVAMTITTDKFDALYQKLKPKGVTMTALLAKACGVALASHPLLYASCTPDGSGVTYNEHINIATAVAMPDGGLITPVLKDADTTDIYTLSRNWADLVKRARAKQLKPEEYSTGTFTISNLGMYGVDSFDAILPAGSAAILAVGGSKPVVAADANGRIGVEKQMKLNMTADHRIVYGAQAAEFLLTLKAVIENPDQLVF